MFKVATVQQAPAFLDRDGALQKAITAVNEAASKGAKLIIFPEVFIPGYPAWIWRLRPGTDSEVTAKLHQQLLNQSVSIEKGHLQPLCETAKSLAVTIVCGVNERDAKRSQTTLYNTTVTISADGKIINKHQKLTPTNAERMTWGLGDSSGLKVVDTPCGRIGGLICWENYNPLARYALYEQGIDIYIAPTYDSGDDWIGSLKHIARESGCWVIGASNVFQASDLPGSLHAKEEMYPDPKEWVNPGDSIIIGPDGTIVAGPMRQMQGILYAEVQLEHNEYARRSNDVAGHSSRPDIFQLVINEKAK